MPHLGDRLDYYQFKVSGARYCLKEIDAMLDEIDNPRLQEKVDEAMELNDRAAQREYDWDNRKKRRRRARKGSNETDDKIDRTLSGIYDVVETNAELAVDSESKRLAEELRDELFPKGVFPITSATFERQHMHVEQLLERLTGRFTEHVDVLGLESVVDRLADLNETFDKQLQIVDEDQITFDEVQAARVEAREAFHKVIHVIFGDYVDAPETREKLLGPVERMDERIGRYVKRRGQIPEVDPDSGEPTG
jgi:hypothetical protein